MKSVLITGASNLAAAAAMKWLRCNDPDSEIHALARSTAGLGRLAQTYEIDFSQDPEAFATSVDNLRIPAVDCIMHFAAAVPETCADPTDFYRVNVINARRLLDRLIGLQPVSVLNFSTASVYAPDETHVTEASRKDRASDYGISKLVFEGILQSFVEDGTRGHKALSVRVPVLLVPGVQRNFLAKWRRSIEAGEEVTLFNPGAPFNACVWIDDIFDFFRRFLSNATVGSLSCNVGSVEPLSVRDVAHELMRNLGQEVGTRSVASDRVAQDYDCSLAMAYGYRPRSVSDALRCFANER